MTESEAESMISYLGDQEGGAWDAKTENIAPLPKSMTPAQVREAVYATRADAAEACKAVLAEVEKLKKQVAWLDRALKDHRHQLESGTFSAKPEF